MNKIREKLIDWKKRLSDRHMYSIVIVLVAAVALWGIYQYKHAADLRQELDNQYNRAFYEMTGYVENVEILLMKSLMSSTPEMMEHTLQEAWHQANMAQTNLGQLPVSQHILANTSKFLSQVGDLSYTFNGIRMNGKDLNDEQVSTIENLHGFATNLNKSLKEMQASLSEGRLRWNELARKGSKLFEKTSNELPAKLFQDMDNNFQEYPTLIYDGPFSDHMGTMQPKGLTGDDLTVEQAQEKLKAFIGADKVLEIVHKGEAVSDTINTYSYEIKLKDRPEEEI
ncbi:MAG: germination protein YpeB, partial [Proteobacteria bacterium]|nr:germination protein YpeB [Pseudomonadota bacterium]